MNIGDQVPSFTLPDQDWNEVESSALLGSPFVLYFYPKDDTPGCTKQACSFRDSFADFEDKGVRVFGISSDSPESHRAFIDRHRLPFSLLSDQKKTLQRAMQVPTNMFGLLPGRVTYVFDDQGMLIHQFNSQMKTEQHVEQALTALESS